MKANGLLLYCLLISLKVVIDAFRLINPNTMVLGQDPRQTTSNLGHLHKPSIQVRSSTFFDMEIVCFVIEHNAKYIFWK